MCSSDIPFDCLYFDPGAPNFTETIKTIPTTPGYCIFIDLVKSTEMKDAPPWEWMIKLRNTFSNAQSYMVTFIRPIKVIGDQLMYYIPERWLRERGETALLVFSSLCMIVNEPDEHLFRGVKVGIAFCQKAYAITYWKGRPDIYGKDIDLAARLVALAEPREILMNDGFYGRVQEDQSHGSKELLEEAKKIRGPWPVMLKGFTEYINVYKLPAAPVAVYDRPLQGC